jgi:hypothetical protein
MMRSIALRDPLDFFIECTVPVSTWLSLGSVERHQQYIAACVAYSANQYAEELRMEPHVAYDLFNDTLYFIFKQDNNGTCIIVGERLPKIPYEDTMEGQ